MLILTTWQEVCYCQKGGGRWRGGVKGPGESWCWWRWWWLRWPGQIETRWTWWLGPQGQVQSGEPWPFKWCQKFSIQDSFNSWTGHPCLLEDHIQIYCKMMCSPLSEIQFSKARFQKVTHGLCRISEHLRTELSLPERNLKCKSLTYVFEPATSHQEKHMGMEHQLVWELNKSCNFHFSSIPCPGISLWEERRSSARACCHQQQSKEHLSTDPRVQDGNCAGDQHVATQWDGQTRQCFPVWFIKIFLSTDVTTLSVWVLNMLNYLSLAYTGFSLRWAQTAYPIWDEPWRIAKNKSKCLVKIAALSGTTCSLKNRGGVYA